MESILTSVKKVLGLPEDYDAFDNDIIMHINSVFMILTQLGVGPSEGYVIVDDANLWDEFIQDEVKLQLVKSYTCLKVRLLFDPPQSSAVLAAMERQIAEFEWRINVAAETPSSNGEEEIQNGV